MEAGVVKAYLEELSKIPYDVQSEEKFDLKYAE
jgi:ATP-dependent Lon protease